ncbi:MAG: hypothetical protein K1X89_21075 [Myxococcaceae bacterium]|nr:hypothetical protein [Myxococcaceae bacterium]
MVTPQQRDWVRREVTGMYLRNRQQGHAAWAKRDYDFVCPSTGTYPFQWLWDSCFHAVVLSHLDIGRARSELESLLANQQSDGFLGHVTFWQREKFEEIIKTYGIAFRTPYLSDCIQPPVFAEALDAIDRRGGGDAYLKQMLPRVSAAYDWLDRMRDPDQDGLIAVVQADETGLDHSVKWDELFQVKAVTLEEFQKAWDRVAKPYDAYGRDHAKMFASDHFIVEDVMVNSIYGLNLQLLAALHGKAGDAANQKKYQAMADRTFQALLKKCWHEGDGLFYDLAGHTAEKHLRHDTFTALMPLVFPQLPKDKAARLIARLEDPKKYAARYPVPTVAMDHPRFEPGISGTKLVWRGPSWMNSNWYLARGLKAHGRADLAQRITDASVELVQKSGFREYYNPLTGEGHGAEDFSWTGLVLDLVEG